MMYRHVLRCSEAIDLRRKAAALAANNPVILLI
jgi:hypothetical protein